MESDHSTPAARLQVGSVTRAKPFEAGAPASGPLLRKKRADRLEDSGRGHGLRGSRLREVAKSAPARGRLGEHEAVAGGLKPPEGVRQGQARGPAGQQQARHARELGPRGSRRGQPVDMGLDGMRLDLVKQALACRPRAAAGAMREIRFCERRRRPEREELLEPAPALVEVHERPLDPRLGRGRAHAADQVRERDPAACEKSREARMRDARAGEHHGDVVRSPGQEPGHMVGDESHLVCPGATDEYVRLLGAPALPSPQLGDRRAALLGVVDLDKLARLGSEDPLPGADPLLGKGISPAVVGLRYGDGCRRAAARDGHEPEEIRPALRRRPRE